MIKVTDAELEVLKIIWEKEKTTSFDIIDILKEKKEWNESTIRTLINRLSKKGAIIPVEKNGKTYTYKANISKDEYVIEESRSLVKKLYNGSLKNMLLNFVKQKDLNKEDIQELMDLIDKEDK